MTRQEVNLLPIRVLQEAGLPADHLHAKGVKPLIAEHFHYVITVCDRAEASCPIFPNARYRMGPGHLRTPQPRLGPMRSA